MKNNYQAIGEMNEKKLPILFWSIVVGVLSGLVVVFYRTILGAAETFSFFMYDLLREHLVWIPVWFLTLLGMGFVVGKLVVHHEMIAGSGIPQVKGILMGYFKDSWFGTLWAKFLGGTIAIIGGLSLGREGPSIQLGANVAQGIGKRLKRTRMERKILLSSGASAGLAAAFNAPLAGVVFALEEIYKYFSPLVLLSTMSAAVMADFVSKQVFGVDPVFHFHVVETIPLGNYWLLLLMGAVLGLGGAAYNKVTLWVQGLYKRYKIKKEYKMMLPFFLAGVLGLVFPVVLGGGHAVIEKLNLETGLLMLFVILAVKFLFSAFSFGSGAPGGIFFPLLVMGGIVGAIFGTVAVQILGFDSSLFYNFVILAMAGFFTAIVRAPITGMVLIIEMTGSFHHLLSLSMVALTAYIVADLVKSTPIYDSLLEYMVKDKDIPLEGEEHSKKIMIETVVQHDCDIANHLVKEIKWPKRCLLLSIRRMEREIIPNGDTRIMEGDYLIFMTDINNEWQAREKIMDMVVGD